MRPLYHPALEEITVQGILYALSDPVRVRIVAELAGARCPQNCSAFLHVGGADLPKSSLSQHMKILRESGLIRSERKGVQLINMPRCAELEPKFGKMLNAIIEAYKKETRTAKSKSR